MRVSRPDLDPVRLPTSFAYDCFVALGTEDGPGDVSGAGHVEPVTEPPEAGPVGNDPGHPSGTWWLGSTTSPCWPATSTAGVDFWTTARGTTFDELPDERGGRGASTTSRSAPPAGPTCLRCVTALSLTAHPTASFGLSVAACSVHGTDREGMELEGPCLRPGDTICDEEVEAAH